MAGNRTGTEIMEYKYSSDVTDGKNAKKMKEAAIQTAVQAIRFLENLK